MKYVHVVSYKLSVFLGIVGSELLILASTLLQSISFDGKKRYWYNLALQIAFGNFRTGIALNWMFVTQIVTLDLKDTKKTFSTIVFLKCFQDNYLVYFFLGRN